MYIRCDCNEDVSGLIFFGRNEINNHFETLEIVVLYNEIIHRTEREEMVYSIYFSPTGGTKKIMDLVTSAFTVNGTIDLSKKEYDFSTVVIEENDLCFIGVPSFAGRVPINMMERLHKM
ncbi:MAG: hypothetical protein R3Y24_15700, partial [Eubacteriales bacterium]